MAIYHLGAQIISRGKGKSATSAAAYRAGCKIHDERSGITFDYSRKKGVFATKILTPPMLPIGQATEKSFGTMLKSLKEEKILNWPESLILPYQVN